MADPWAALSPNSANPQTAPKDQAPFAAPATSPAGPSSPGTGASPWGTFGSPAQTFAPAAGTSPWDQPNSALLNLNAVPQATATSYSPGTMAQLHAAATQDAAQTGMQQLAATKRMLGQSGVQGPAAAGYTGNVARQTGEAEAGANRDINLGVAQGNMQTANQMALQNANMMFQALQANQAARLNTQNAALGL